MRAVSMRGETPGRLGTRLCALHAGEHVHKAN